MSLKTIFSLFRFKIISLFFPLLFIYGTSQASYETFDSLFKYLAFQLTNTDKDIDYIKYEELLKKAETAEQEIKALMLIATLQGDRGNYAQAINDANLALEKAALTNDSNWSIRINGFLSSIYRDVNLFEQGKKHLLLLQEMVKMSDVTEVALGLISQEFSNYMIEEGKYIEAINELQNAKLNLKDEKNVELYNYYQSTNYYMIGNCYYKLGNYKEAKTHFKQSLQLSKENQNNVTGLAHVGLAAIAFQDDSLDLTKACLIEADKLSQNSKSYELKIQIADLFSKYYQKIGEYKKALEYQNQYIALVDKKTESIKLITNQLQAFSENKETHSNNNFYNNKAALIIIIILLCLFLSIFISYIFKRKIYNLKNLFSISVGKVEKQEELIEKLEDIQENVPNPTINNNNNNPAYKIKKNDQIEIPPMRNDINNDEYPTMAVAANRIVISAETTNHILKELERFELNESYMESGVSLTNLSTQFSTNTKYLSIIINEHKHTDFNNYINTLRINNITNKLKNNPEYLDYKISHLASISGFSSHSKFTSVFKQITGKLPLIYIKEIKESGA